MCSMETDFFVSDLQNRQRITLQNVLQLKTIPVLGEAHQVNSTNRMRRDSPGGREIFCVKERRFFRFFQ